MDSKVFLILKQTGLHEMVFVLMFISFSVAPRTLSGVEIMMEGIVNVFGG